MTGWLTLWWAWIAFAMVLGIIEILAPGFIFLGIALGAAIVALLLLVMPDVIAGLGFSTMMALFAALSLVSWLGLRYAFRHQSSGAEIFTDDVND